MAYFTTGQGILLPCPDIPPEGKRKLKEQPFSYCYGYG